MLFEYKPQLNFQGIFSTYKLFIYKMYKNEKA